MPDLEKAPRKEIRGIQPFDTVIIANSRIAAVLAARVCEEKGIKAVIPYSITDPYTNATRMVESHADQGWKLYALGGYTPTETYANGNEMLEAALIAKRKGENLGIYLGYGFLSEDAEFIRICREHGIKAIAPTPEAMEITGSKVNARALAEQLHIPILQGTPLLANPHDVVNAAHKLGFPVILKDPDTGGGIGNIIARDKNELERAFKILRSREGNKGIYIEHYVEHAAHVEIQIAADDYGHVISLGERDCTMQRRHQKFIEESPSPYISKKMREEIEKAAVRFTKSAGYTNVGTFEVIIDLDHKDKTGYPTTWYFMEFNPRLQVENKVTQLRTGIDIVRLAFDLAEGRPLPFTQKQVKQSGHAMEFRVYAEDPYNNFEATPGILTTFQYPSERPNVIIDTAYIQGDSISSWFDPTAAHVIVSGNTRAEAISLGIEILSNMKIRGEDVTSNLPFLIEAIQTNEFRLGNVYTTFPEQWWQKKLKEQNKTAKDNPAMKPTLLLDPDRLPQNPVVPSRDPSKPPVEFKAKLQKTREETGMTSAAEYKIETHGGMHMVVFKLNPDFIKGSFGSGEEFVFEDACRVAKENNLPLVTILPSGGISQDENMVGLTQMRQSRRTLRKSPPLTHYDNLDGMSLGGTTVIAKAAQIQIGVDNLSTRTGITGPNMVYVSQEGSPPTFGKAEEIYKALGDVHAPSRHFRNRNLHVLEPDTDESFNTISHIEQILNYVPMNSEGPIAIPKRNIHTQELPSGLAPHENPDSRVRAWFVKRISPLRERLQRDQEEISIFEASEDYDLPPANERLHIINHPNRPTAADLIDPDYELFDDSQLLTTGFERADKMYEYPTTIAAVARLDGHKVLVLAHQSQVIRDETTGQLKKHYAPQRPEDLEYLMKMLEFGKKRQLPIMAFCDTRGLACKPEDEDRNQLQSLSDLIDETNEYPYPILSYNIGMIGSGGGIILASPFDYAAFAENALGFVADPRVMYWIKTGRWISPNDPPEKQSELALFINQFHDATAEGAKKIGFIDDNLKEGKGGAHIEPLILAREIRGSASANLTRLKRLSTTRLINRRDERLERVSHIAAVVNEEYYVAAQSS